MAFFEILLNSCKEHSIERSSFKYLEVGLISVGPIFDINLLCNGVYTNTNKAVSILNKKIAIGDIVDINYYISNSENETVTSKTIAMNDTSYATNLSEVIGTKVRLFKIDFDDGRHFAISATKNTTLIFNCIWLKKDNQCTVTLGNSDDNGNEQWLKTLLEINSRIKIQIE